MFGRQPVIVISSIALGVIAIAGIVTVALSLLPPAGGASLGWFAYAPTSGAVFTPEDAVIIPRAAVFGGVLFGFGMVGLSFVFGLLYGRRRTQ